MSLLELCPPAPQASLSKDTLAHKRDDSQPKIAGLLSSAYNRHAPSPAFQCPRYLHAVTSLLGPRTDCVNSWEGGSPPGAPEVCQDAEGMKGRWRRLLGLLAEVRTGSVNQVARKAGQSS